MTEHLEANTPASAEVWHGLVETWSEVGLPEEADERWLEWAFFRLQSIAPETGDQDPTRVGWMNSTRLQKAQLQILGRLADAGSWEAVYALERIAAATHWKLDRHLDAARDATYRKTWSPPTPSQLLAMVADPRKRLVHTPAQLREAIAISLEALEERWWGGRSATGKPEPHAAEWEWRGWLLRQVEPHLSADLPAVIANWDVAVEISREHERPPCLRVRLSSDERHKPGPAAVIHTLWLQDVQAPQDQSAPSSEAQGEPTHVSVLGATVSTARLKAQDGWFSTQDEAERFGFAPWQISLLVPPAS